MVAERELLVLALGIGALAFVRLNRHQLMRLPGIGLLTFSLAMWFVGWALGAAVRLGITAWELDALQHVCQAGGSLLLAAWCVTALKKKAGSSHG